ncbi:hypothetical protein FRB98_002862, partial [Tulasnella sp. 332]
MRPLAGYATWLSALPRRSRLRLSNLRWAKPSSNIFLRLPVELNLEILNYLDTKEVLSVLRTCRAMRTIAEVCLYTHITIGMHQGRRLSGVVRTLSTRPDLAQRVVTWNGYLFPLLYEPGPFRKSSSKLLSKLNSPMPLSHMVNLNSLTIHSFNPLWSVSYRRVRPTLDAICLTTLIITGPSFRWPNPNPGDERELAMILKSQPLLQHLELRSGKWDMGEWLSPVDLSHLHSLAAREEDARRLIPGRPITSLTLFDIDKVLDESSWQELAASSTSTYDLTFCVTRKDLITPFLQSAAKHLELESLRVTFLPIEHVAKVYENFPVFSRLRSLTVILQSGSYNQPRLEECLANLRKGVQKGSPSVERVTLVLD